MNIFIYTLSIVLVLSSLSFSQEKVARQMIDSLPLREVDLGYKSYPVVFADSAGTFPDTILIRGIVEGITSVPAPCGIFCWWGTAMIRLEHKPIGNLRDTVYIAVMCLYGNDSDFVGKTIEISVSQLLKSDLHQGCEVIVNRFDSHGKLFYRLTDEDMFQLGKLW